MPEDYRLWVDERRRIMVRLWNDGTMEVASREHPDAIWGPPFVLKEEKDA